jgi:Domain of unknown function (DUF3471)
VDVDAKTLSSYVGSYALSPKFILVITMEGENLEAQATGQSKFKLDAESNTIFFPEVFDAKIEFVKDDAGRVTGLVLHQGGHDVKATKQ